MGAHRAGKELLFRSLEKTLRFILALFLFSEEALYSPVVARPEPQLGCYLTRPACRTPWKEVGGDLVKLPG
jgi:hypothetical protein